MRRSEGGVAVLDEEEVGVNGSGGDLGLSLGSKELNEVYSGKVAGAPYIMRCLIRGTTPILFHRYDCEEVESKGRAARGSEEKKTDNVEAYYYRDKEGHVCIPAVGIKGSLRESGRWTKDPRSARKSAMDLVRAGLTVEPYLVPCMRNGKKIEKADFIDQRRVQVMRAAIGRKRPALDEGWEAEFDIMVMAADLIVPTMCRELLTRAGQMVGLCDHRPEFGKFEVIRAEVVGLEE